MMLWLLLAFFYLFSTVDSLGGEKRSFFTEEFTPNITHRQNVCHRYESVRSGELELRYALDGFELRPVMSTGEFFNYDDTNGIRRNEPGLMADLLDEIGRRAGFKWRNSFGVTVPESFNATFTDRLLWGIDTYDIAINWWDKSVERLEKGATYVEPWFDGSIILINKEDPVEANTTGNLSNWLRPFDSFVWILTLFTIFLSGLVYQWIEALHDERDDRPWSQWMADNLYLSMLNFTQNYEYAPNSLAGRVFGVSMGIWALVMTATYTANLASLFVEEGKQPVVVDSIDEAIARGVGICIYEGTNADATIKAKYDNVIRVPKVTELEAYQALQRGECGLMAGYRDNWLGYRGNSRYNPDCDLEWVGRTVEIIQSGFVVKSDAGYLCTSLVRDVFNLHMTELISDGILEDLWSKHRAKTQDINCDVEVGDNSVESSSSSSSEGNVGRQRSRTLRADTTFSSTMARGEIFPTATTTGITSPAPRHHRKLDGAKSADGSSSDDPASSSLTLQQMLGTFVLHWGLMLFAILISAFSNYYAKHTSLFSSEKKKNAQPETEQVTFRKNGPIIGSPPRLNTSFAIRNPVVPPLDVAMEDGGDDTNNDHSRNDSESNSQSYGDYSFSNLHGPIRHNHGFNQNRQYRNRNQNRNDILFQSLQNEFRTSYSELQTTQRHLASQMDAVVSLFQQVMEQQEQQQQGPNVNRNRLFSQRKDQSNCVNGRSLEEEIILSSHHPTKWKKNRTNSF